MFKLENLSHRLLGSFSRGVFCFPREHQPVKIHSRRISYPRHQIVNFTVVSLVAKAKGYDTNVVTFQM